jgi:hypothetical protein
MLSVNARRNSPEVSAMSTATMSTTHSTAAVGSSTHVHTAATHSAMESAHTGKGAGLRAGKAAGAKGLRSKALARGCPCPTVECGRVPRSIGKCAGIPRSSAYSRGTIPRAGSYAGISRGHTGWPECSRADTGILSSGDRGTSESGRGRASGRG